MVKPSEIIAVAAIGIIGIVAYLLYKGTEDIASALSSFQLPNLSPSLTLPSFSLTIPSLSNLNLPSITNPFAPPEPPDYHQGQIDLTTKTFPQISEAYAPAIQQAFQTNPSSLGVTPSTNRFKPAIG